MKKIILFGCSGMLGNYVYYTLINDFVVYCFSREDFNIESKDWHLLEKKITSILDENDVIINCAGVIPQKDNLNTINLEKYICVNSMFPNKLSNICNKYNYKLIHITTDCVYDGTKGKYFEDDLHTDKNIYGLSKSAGECNNACIIRTSIIGEEINGKKSFIEWIISNENKEINGYDNHLWNGITCLSLSKFIKSMILGNKYWNGVRHLFSEKDVTKYELCNMINKIYNLNIKINKINAEITINRTLRSKFDIISNLNTFNTLEEQIIEQKEFNIKSKINSRENYASPASYNYRYYLIHNLDVPRKFRMLNEFKKFNIDNNCVKWILYPNRTDLTEEFLKKNTFDGSLLYSHHIPYPLKNGQIACTYKHYLALKDIVQNNYEHSVIIEDNIGFKNNVPERLNLYLKQLPENWSILFEHDVNVLPYNENIKNISNSIYVYPKSNYITDTYHGGSRGAAFYLLNNKTAKLLHDKFIPMGTVSDMWYNNLFRLLNINSYWTSDTNIYVAPHISTSLMNI